MRLPLPALALGLGLLLVAPALTPTAPALAPAPCRDPRGCPDMTIDLSTLVVIDQNNVNANGSNGACLVEEGYVPATGTYRMARLNLGAPNVGKGDLVLGKPSENPDLFFFSNCHGHWHLRDYITTRVWKTAQAWATWEQIRQANPDWTAAQAFAAHPELVPMTTFAAKVSFCAIDIYPQPANQGGVGVPDPLPKYTDCNNQGVSVGWADLYIWMQLGNWADITGLPTGVYILEAEVNAQRLFQEVSYANNRGALPFVVDSHL